MANHASSHAGQMLSGYWKRSFVAEKLCGFSFLNGLARPMPLVGLYVHLLSGYWKRSFVAEKLCGFSFLNGLAQPMPLVGLYVHLPFMSFAIGLVCRIHLFPHSRENLF
jgi:hypothetical protein